MIPGPWPQMAPHTTDPAHTKENKQTDHPLSRNMHQKQVLKGICQHIGVIKAVNRSPFTPKHNLHFSLDLDWFDLS